MYHCPWCPPESQCWSCERAEFWDDLLARHAPAVLAAFDAELAERTSPARIERLGALFGASERR